MHKQHIYSNHYMSRLFEYIEQKLNKDIAIKCFIQMKPILDKNDYEYNNLYRICEVGDKEQEKEYDNIYKSGCCGFFEQLIKIDKKTYKIGFNYGH